MVDYEKLRESIIECGMDKKWSKMFVKKLMDDENAFPTDDKTKEWALKRGFFPGRVQLYGLNEENYTDYLPDYNYFMLHPLNHHFRIWINDKLSMKYTLNSNGCEDTMPEYYLYIENNGNYTYLFDAPSQVKKDKDFILNLLKLKKTLAIKPNSGTSGGLGFMKVEYKNDTIFVNNKPITFQEYGEIVSKLKNNIVTQYVYQHKELAEVWPDSECTLRVIMAKIPSHDPYKQLDWECIISFARFGASVSGGASNLSSGGIGVGINFETGKYKDFAIRYKRFCSDGEYKCHHHPDTQFVFKGKSMPNWELVKEKILRVCSHISSLDYLGFDVIVTQDGMKFCEINTHPAADYAQVMCSPILRNERAKSFFESKGLYNIKSEDFYTAYKNSIVRESI